MTGGDNMTTPAWLRGKMEAPAGEHTEGGFTRGVFTAEQQARLGVDENGRPVAKDSGGGGGGGVAGQEGDGAANGDGGGKSALRPGRMTGGDNMATPAWIRGEMEPPAGVSTAGGFTRGVFTEEQQARLGVDENGLPVAAKDSGAGAPAGGDAAAAADDGDGENDDGCGGGNGKSALRPGRMTGGDDMATPAWLRGEMEAPAGVSTDGGFTRGVFTPEQQARLGVDENGQPAVATSSPDSPAATEPAAAQPVDSSNAPSTAHTPWQATPALQPSDFLAPDELEVR